MFHTDAITFRPFLVVMCNVCSLCIDWLLHGSERIDHYWGALWALTARTVSQPLAPATSLATVAERAQPRSRRADQGREQPYLVPVRVCRAPDRLAVQPDLHQRTAARRAVIRPARNRRGESGRPHQPGAYGSIEYFRSAPVSTRQIVVFDGAP